MKRGGFPSMWQLKRVRSGRARYCGMRGANCGRSGDGCRQLLCAMTGEFESGEGFLFVVNDTIEFGICTICFNRIFDTTDLTFEAGRPLTRLLIVAFCRLALLQLCFQLVAQLNHLVSLFQSLSRQ